MDNAKQLDRWLKQNSSHDVYKMDGFIIVEKGRGDVQGLQMTMVSVEQMLRKAANSVKKFSITDVTDHADTPYFAVELSFYGR